MSKISVSVIMPSLNVATYIEESIRSVEEQSLGSIEIICVDAGSTDGTLDVIEAVCKRDSRVKLIKSAVKSYGYQVNLGIDFAKGEYIAVVETDDYISSNMLADLYEVAVKHRVDIVKGDYQAYWTQDDGKRVFLSRMVCSDKTLYGRVIQPEEYPSVSEDDWYLWNGIYKKSFLKEKKIQLNESRGAAFQDIGFLHLSNAYAAKVWYINRPYYFYCIDREDSSSNSGKGLLFARNEYDRLFELGEQEKVSLYIRMAKSMYCCMTRIENWELLMTEEYAQAYMWMRDKLEEAIKKGTIDESCLSRPIWSEMDHILSSVEEYSKYRLQMEEELERRICQRSVVIFGCGNYGYEAYKWLIKRNYNVSAYMDNNSKLWGTTINGIPVLSPSESMNFAESVFWVANEKYREDIMAQLAELGIPMDNLVYMN